MLGRFSSWAAHLFYFCWWVVCALVFQVSLTGHRYIEVVHPLHAYRLCRVGLVAKQYIVIIAVAICIDIPRYFEVKLTTHNDSYVYLSQTSLLDNSIYLLVFKTIFVMTLRLLLPIVLTVIFTFALGHAIYKTRQKIAKRVSVGGPSISSKSTHTNGLQFTKRRTAHRDRLTFSFTIIAVLTLFCLTPGMVDFVYSLFFKEFMLPCPNIYGILAEIGEICLVLNSATNFYIYYPTLETFRRDVWNLLQIRRNQCTPNS